MTEQTDVYKRQGLDDDELPWLIQTKENDPNGVYGNFVLLDAQVDNANPRNMLIDENGFLHSGDPVSYTHLDVYKRQTCNSYPSRRMVSISTER